MTGAALAARPVLEVAKERTIVLDGSRTTLRFPVVYALGAWQPRTFAETLERVLELAERNDRGRRHVRQCPAPVVLSHQVAQQQWDLGGAVVTVTVATIGVVASSFAAAALERLWAAGGPRS